MKVIEQLESSITSGRQQLRDTFIETKTSMERTLALHQAQHEANAKDLEAQLKGNIFTVELLKMAKNVSRLGEELRKLEQKDGRHSKEREEKLEKTRKLLDVSLGALRNTWELSAWRDGRI